MSLLYILKVGSNQLEKSLRKEYHGVLSKNGKIITYNSVRTYRNICHTDMPSRPFIASAFPLFLICLYIGVVFDFKKIFGYYNEEEELEKLKNYTIPDLVVTYTVKPGLEDTGKT